MIAKKKSSYKVCLLCKRRHSYTYFQESLQNGANIKMKLYEEKEIIHLNFYVAQTFDMLAVFMPIRVRGKITIILLHHPFF